MATFVFKVESVIAQEWYVEAESKDIAEKILFQEGSADENTKEEFVKNIQFVGEE